MPINSAQVAKKGHGYLNRTNRRFWRKFRAGLRDTVLLLREFRQPLFLFALAIVGSGWLYYVLAAGTQQPVDSLSKSIYITLTLTFLQPFIDFPAEWYLQIFFFVMPVVGVGILAQGLADFGVLLFNRRARGKEWEMAVASTFNNHLILVGLGHLGFRVVKMLNELNQDVVVIEAAPKPDLLHNIREMGVTVIEDDGTRETVLLSAGVQRARSIILCTQDDSLNLRMALKARNINPKIEVIIRIFDDEFAASLENQFGFHAMSATGMAAPLFAAVAAQVDITPPITIEGQAHIVANLHISPRSRLCDETVNEIEEKYRVSIIMLCQDGERKFHPSGQERIEPGQTMAVFGEPEQIYPLIHESNR